MRAVMISIRPKWCERIVNGEKTIEIRKSRPNLQEPFKCYVYCTTGKRYKRSTRFAEAMFFGDGTEVSNGKVIGEFVCDRVYQYSSDWCGCRPPEGSNISTEEIVNLSCLTAKELHDYEYSVEPKENCIYLVGIYGWHISNLVIYEKPKNLSEFTALRKTKFGYEPIPVKRPPQSWCYVEGGS